MQQSLFDQDDCVEKTHILCTGGTGLLVPQLPTLHLVAGVDEAGRGPLVGSVVAAAVILPDVHTIKGLADSKTLSEKKRDQLFVEITTQAVAYAVAECTPEEIDEYNILHASLLAMQRAIHALPTPPHNALIDGNKIPKGCRVPCEAHVKGDAKFACISAASILAKVMRDQQMQRLHTQYPQYGFDQHKGYPTAQHMAALQQYGVLSVHRKSFKPVAMLLN